MQKKQFQPTQLKKEKNMEITNELINKLARLSKLEFDETAKAAIQKDLQQMIGFIEKINELDTEEVEPLIHMSEDTNVFREDIAKTLITQKEGLKNAPAKNEEYILVPKVINK